MKKWQKVNLIFFAVVVISMASLVYVLGTMNFSSPFGKPWHLLPSVHEDSLSQKYLNEYRILNSKSLYKQMYDSSCVNFFILVDAWGVPVEEELLEADFALFKDVSHMFVIHQRLANRTKHAERVEFRNTVSNNIYLFGGDSLEYNRPVYIKELGIRNTLFCQHCNDSIMLVKIDSLLANDSLRLIVWTTQSARSGDRDSLRNSLGLIAKFAQKHSNIHIVVQGTHRPVLGSAETRNKHKSHWVPAAILNVKRMDVNDSI